MHRLVLTALLALAACDGPHHYAASPDAICDGPYADIFCDNQGYLVGYDGIRVRDRNNRRVTGYAGGGRPMFVAPPEPWEPLDTGPDFSGHYDISPVVLDHPEFGREFSGPGFSCTQAPLLMGRRDLGSTIDCD